MTIEHREVGGAPYLPAPAPELSALGDAFARIADTAVDVERARIADVDRAIERERLERLSPEALRALPEWSWVNVVAMGFDTLHVTGPLTIPESVQHKLDRSRRHLEQGVHHADCGEECTVRLLDGRRYEVQKSGGGLYRWMLKGEIGNLLIGRRRRQGASGVKIEIGSQGCWYLGPRRALEHLKRAVAELLGCAETWPAKATRVDFCCDFQGAPLDENLAGSMVTRAHTFSVHVGPNPLCLKCGAKFPRGGTACDACHHVRGTCVRCKRPALENSEHCGVCSERTDDERTEDGRRKWIADIVEMSGRTFGKFREFTGWQWGRGNPMVVRLYDKDEEIKVQSKKFWFVSVWERADGYDPERTVWRLEVECKTGIIQKLKVGGVKIETVDQIFDHANSIWRYLVGYWKRVCPDCGEPTLRARARYCDTCRRDERVKLKRVREGELLYRCPECEYERIALVPREKFCAYCVDKDQPVKLKRPRGWAEIRIPDHSRACSDWKLHPFWRRIQNTYFEGSQAANPQIKRLRNQARAEIAVRGGKGNLSSFVVARNLDLLLAAQLGRPPSMDELWKFSLERFAAEGNTLEEFYVGVQMKRRVQDPDVKEPEYDAETKAKAERLVAHAQEFEERRARKRSADERGASDRIQHKRAADRRAAAMDHQYRQAAGKLRHDESAADGAGGSGGPERVRSAPPAASASGEGAELDGARLRFLDCLRRAPDGV